MQFFGGIDPSHTNLLACVLFFLDHDYTLYTIFEGIELKKRTYYHEAGFQKHKKLEDIWLRDFVDIYEQSSRVSTKTTNVEQIDAYLRIYAGTYVLLWTENTKRKHRRLNFHCSNGKQSYLTAMSSELFHPFLPPGEVPLLFMGSANISSTIKGTTPAPMQYIQVALRRFCEVIKSLENRSIFICSWCGGLTKQCATHGPLGYPDYVRGLEFYPGII
eukprot:CAMPEP_0201972896 /NCGR_PEP_ID=MMETSP0904-20121228/43776_1 /ASSEMBLY_ACC=CAM_ASM_000553 /TAXON_ID=420261 /ORGANISM="Thalassiosira antarctica, Strain CCMP982" /LENGTH=216 /DNA_ID=CAMNT_0048522887 /DNA_START=60 /DNA_END=707 /DNA_ORIENTATION=+